METFDRHSYRILVAIAITTLATGTIFYHLVEKFSWLNSYYFSVVTLATVGYGDFTPHTDAGKIFTTFYIFIGVGIVTAFISSTLRRSQFKMHNRQIAREDRKEDKKSNQV